jgi:hypothetical protein
MKRTDTFWGGLLVVAGVVLLLLNLGVFGAADEIVGSLLLGAGGVLFLGLFVARAQWWAAIPAGVLLSLATLTAIEQIAPRQAEVWGGALFLGGTSLGFWAIALTQPRHWWAIIPGGVLLTVALVAGLDQARPGQDYGGVVLLGIAATFGIVSLVSPSGKRMTWALIPATVLGVIGVAVLTQTAAWLGYVWPAALIGAGLYLIYRTQRGVPNETPGDRISPKEERYDDPTLPQPH